MDLAFYEIADNEKSKIYYDENIGERLLVVVEKTWNFCNNKSTFILGIIIKTGNIGSRLPVWNRKII